jgi:tetratricopeptide (TPR) repeat protein
MEKSIMPILGPDGNPIESGPPAPDEVKQIVEQAKALAAQGDVQTALQQLGFAFQYDVSSDLILNTSCDFLEQINRARSGQAGGEVELFQRLRDNRDDAEGYYILANNFFQAGQAFLANPFYARARQLLGGGATQLSQMADVEHGQVLMELGHYQQAVDVFQKLNDDFGGLPVELILKMTECYALLRQLDAAQALYSIVPEDNLEQSPGLLEWFEEVGDLIARVDDFADKKELGLREWHYAQTRGVLLETNPDANVPGGRFIFFQPSEEDVAYVVSQAAAILDHKGYAPNRLLWLGATSEPLARLFAQWWDITEENLRPYQPGDNTDDESHLTLLVMSHSYDFAGLISEEEVANAQDEQALQMLQGERLAEIADAREGMILFMLNVLWTDRQPVVPDIAGFLSQQCNLPWETRLQVDMQTQNATPIEETRDAQTIATEIAAQFPSEEEADKWAQETLEEYAGCTDLILDHRDGSLKRKSMVTHSPVVSPRFGY